ncbi:conserved hypothetical protein [Tenacibaculum sp. 190524A05c]|uniref:hypothetical protein n=1 Tax=Tenacibaculum platacis TaxID=3137852 RepID=UPI0031FB6ADA
MEDVKTIIQEIVSSGGKIQTYAAKVISVNIEENSNHDNPEEAYSVNVVRSDGAQIDNVRLKASIQDKEQGVICVPKLNSWVFISIIETTETRAFISQYSEIDKIFLRIKNDENSKFFEVQTDVNSTSLLFKQVVEETGDDGQQEASLKNITSLVFDGEQKDVAIKFWNDEGEKVIHQTTVAHDKVETEFINNDDDIILQRTTIDASKVAVDFQIEENETKGYSALIDKENILFKNTTKNIELEMTNKFKVEAGGKNLKLELESLIDEVSKIVVLQGTSPNVGMLNTIKGNIGQILK